MSSQNFQLYSAYYNLLYKDKEYAKEVKYMEALFAKFSAVELSSILNLGCGTGNHDVLFSEKGYSVHGVDLSDGMVNDANKKINPSNKDKLSFSQGDIRTIRLNKKFDSVISLFHVMSYQTSNADLENVFQTAKEHLNPGGLFIFDCWHGPAVLADPPVIKVKEVEDEQIMVHRKAIPVIHFDEKIVDVNFEINVTGKQDGRKEKFNELHRMRYLFGLELKEMGIKNGFEELANYKWLSFETPSEKSWNVVYLFRLN